MKSKFVEFARLPDEILEAAVEHFDDSDERTAFLEMVAASKMAYLLERRTFDRRISTAFIGLLLDLDRDMSEYGFEYIADKEVLEEMVKEYKK